MMDIMTRHQPDGWKLRSLGQVFAERKEKGSDRDFPALSVTMNGIVPQLETAAKTDRGDDRKVVRAGDYVINSRSDRKGSGGISDLEGSVSLISIVMKPTDIEPKFAHHLLRSVAFQEEFYRFGRGIVADLWSTRFDDLKRIQVYLPPKEQQNRIAEDLDRETARIDALIEKKTRFIELLKEKRQVLITQAVTKGLDPTVPMKDSGVEWIGEVPAHWSFVPIKRFSKIGNGSTPSRNEPGYWTGGNVPWLTSGFANHDRVTQADEFVTSKALRECHLPMISPPAVLVGITGQGKTRGMATTLTIEATINQHIAYIKPRSRRVHIDFLRLFIDSAYDWLRFDSEGSGSTKGAITCEQLGNVLIPLPDTEEQVEIVKQVRLQLERIASIIEISGRSIDLLKERRSALITAAVTGQIDLREEAA